MPRKRRTNKKNSERGRNGGLTVSQNREHMAAIGRRGAERTNAIKAQKRMRAQIADTPIFAAIVHE
jgi:general stress protein YciG